MTFNPFGFNKAEPVEPSAEIKALAHFQRQVFLAHMEYGFTAEEALALTQFTLSMGMAAEEELDE